MRRILYWPSADRLVYLDANATPEFWDARWRAAGKAPQISPNDPVVAVTKRHLAPGAKVLEGGCGRANKVKAMSDAGFAATGIDFARQSVVQARLDYPGLDIREGDVRALDIASGSFDGYWSIGVIEHFWSGYTEILAEAARILRRHGFLFLTAPWFSPYRQRKARRGGYERTEFAAEPEAFYQFALSRSDVESRLRESGFELLRWRGIASEISLREDTTSTRGQFEWLLGSRGSLPKRLLRRATVSALNPYCGHSFLAIARRT